MSEENKSDNSIEEQISRISANFESDILRLIKTQSMIKTSGGMLDEEISYLTSKTEQLQTKLSELNTKSNELSDFLQVSLQDEDMSSSHIGLYLKEFISSITKETNELNSIKKELSDRLRNGSEKLQSLHQFYIAELEAFQSEVDSGLTNIRKEIKEKMDKELEAPVIELKEEEVEQEIEELPTSNDKSEPVEIENEEEYYQKMFASSNNQNGPKQSGDKFLYFALGFILLCIAGFIGYYLKYIRPAKTGEMVILEELYEPGLQQKNQMAGAGQSDANEKSSDSLPLVEDPVNPGQYLLLEKVSSTKQADTSELKATVRVKRANIRSGPGRNYGVVSVLTYGNSVEQLNEDSGIWTKIKLQNGKVGWVAKKLLSK